MDVKSIDVRVAADLFCLWLIGIGPEIALVPFLEPDTLQIPVTARWSL